eukprot:2012942-Prorocentrum_lima.AAC.1
MTSSLVGSEMCIRDRRLAHPCVKGLLLPAQHDVAHRCLAPAEGLQIPVSYTHLTLPTICSV